MKARSQSAPLFPAEGMGRNSSTYPVRPVPQAADAGLCLDRRPQLKAMSSMAIIVILLHGASRIPSPDVTSVYPISPLAEIFSFGQVVFDFPCNVDPHIGNVLPRFVQGELVAWGQASWSTRRSTLDADQLVHSKHVSEAWLVIVGSKVELVNHRIGRKLYAVFGFFVGQSLTTTPSGKKTRVLSG